VPPQTFIVLETVPASSTYGTTQAHVTVVAHRAGIVTQE